MSRLFKSLAIFLACSALITSASAEVYKRVNPDGSIEFTDVPGEIGEKPIEVAPSSSYSPPPQPAPAASASKSKKTATSYESVSITSPANDTTVRDNEGNISINIVAKPGLQTGHSYVLKMDGKQVGKGSTNKFQVKNVDRGTHNFTVEIIDENKKAVIQSESVTVHLQRAFVKNRKR